VRAAVLQDGSSFRLGTTTILVKLRPKPATEPAPN